jgi:hypothetical protein
MGLDTVQTNRLDYDKRYEALRTYAWDLRDIFCMIPMGGYPPVGILFVPPKMRFPSKSSHGLPKGLWLYLYLDLPFVIRPAQ